MQSGGHVAEIMLKGAAGVNPLWVQNRPTLDAEQLEIVERETGQVIKLDFVDGKL